MRRVLKWCGDLWLAVAGWERVGEPPKEAKYVIIAAPHTSNWDLPFMLAFAWAWQMELTWLGKHTLFEGRFAGFFRWLGGIPVDRRSRNNVVQNVAEEFTRRERMALAISPEGTRSYRDHWKSGFYHIALEAGVPIALSFLDFGRRRGGFGPVLIPTGNVKADMDRIRAFYEGMKGVHPELQSRIVLPAEEPEASEAVPTRVPEGV